MTHKIAAICLACLLMPAQARADNPPAFDPKPVYTSLNYNLGVYNNCLQRDIGKPNYPTDCADLAEKAMTDCTVTYNRTAEYCRYLLAGLVRENAGLPPIIVQPDDLARMVNGFDHDPH